LGFGRIGGTIGAEDSGESCLKKITVKLLAFILFLAGAASAETVKKYSYVEGTVVGARRFRQGLTSRTKISLREDGEYEAADSRRFCGNWEKKLNQLRGKRIRIDLIYKEYAPSECLKIDRIEILDESQISKQPTTRSQAFGKTYNSLLPYCIIYYFM
jgi:hypothetical protein